MHWEEPQIVSKEGEILQIVSFILGAEEFAFEISRVKEIIRMMEITKVPRCPDIIEGVINLRGTLIPIVDLRKRFLLDFDQYQRSTRIIVVTVEDIVAGFIVDAVLETRQIPIDCIEPPPTIVMGRAESEYITGVAKLEDRLLSLLDVEKILALSDLSEP